MSVETLEQKIAKWRYIIFQLKRLVEVMDDRPLL
ncbi:hypothetical protein J582_4158, partial [Acinetobacter sp. 1566109]